MSSNPCEVVSEAVWWLIVSVLLLCVQIAKEVEATVHSFGLRGIRCLAVARTVEGTEDQWEMLGIMTFLDPPRPDTKRTIERAMEYGVSVKMITGMRHSFFWDLSLNLATSKRQHKIESLEQQTCLVLP